MAVDFVEQAIEDPLPDGRGSPILASKSRGREPQSYHTDPSPLAPEPSRLLTYLFFVSWFGFLFFYGLNSGELWKTEGLRAIIGAEFLRTGNWIVPTLYGEPYFTKPPGMYAAIALISLPFGQVTEWSARMPSAIAATLTVLMLYAYFARIFGRRGGLLIAVLAPMSPMWINKATAAEIDMMQVMWVTGSILCLLRALEMCGVRSAECGVEKLRELSTTHHPPSSAFWWFAALLCVAGGVLTKWTAPAFFYATAIPLLWWRGQLRLLLGKQHLLAAAVGASICVAWIVAAVATAGWDALYETVKRESLQRMLPSYAPETDPWYVTVLHPLKLLYTCLPWSLVALLACRPGFGRLWDERSRLVWQGMICWVWPNVVIWSLMLDHKSRHSFPLFPGFAGLAALVWIAWLDGRLAWKWSIQPKRVLVAALVCWMIAKLCFVNIAVPRRQGRDLQGKAAVIAGLVPTDCILYLFMLKDEGIMFYYGRPVLRLANPLDLPSHGEPLYCILAQDEWDRWRQTSTRPAESLTENLTDSQGAPMVLVRVN